MNTARSCPAVLSIHTSGGDYIIVMGGCSGVDWTCTVELK